METTIPDTKCSNTSTIPVDSVRLFTSDFDWDGRLDGWTTISEDLSDAGKGVIRLRYHDPATGWYVKLNATHHRLEMGGSIPRLLYVDNGRPISAWQWISVKTTVAAMLGSLGISTVINRLQIGRVDVFQDTELPVPVGVLTTALHQIRSVNRLKNRSSREFEDNYVRFENSRRCVVLYDKGREQGVGRSTRHLRCEVRLKRAAAAVDHGLVRFEDLMRIRKLLRTWTSNFAPVIERAKRLGFIGADKGFTSVSDALLNLLEDADSTVRDLVGFIAANGGVLAVTATVGGRARLDEVLRMSLPDHKARRARRRIDELVGDSISVDGSEDGTGLAEFLDGWVRAVDGYHDDYDDEERYEED